MTEDEAVGVIGHYAANLPTAAAYEAEDFLKPRILTATCACVGILTADETRGSGGAQVVLRLDDNGTLSALELRDGKAVETFYGAPRGGRLTVVQSVNRVGDDYTFPDESVTFKHPLATFTIDRTAVTSDSVLQLIDALKGFCGRA